MLAILNYDEIAAKLVELGQIDEILSEQLEAVRRSKLKELQEKVSDPTKEVALIVKKRVRHLASIRKQNTDFLKEVIQESGEFPTASKVGIFACLEALRILAHSSDEKFKQKQIKQLMKLDPAYISPGELNFILELTNPSKTRSQRSRFEIIASYRCFEDKAEAAVA